ncbi:MAG: D-alanine--D-alanine ligase, partial [Planctomycetes bacterium]|nr:D-alanine--D-alanine ligase [Planctomycetota bacterium]
MPSLEVLVLYNEPALRRDDPDWASEAGVLEAVAAISAGLSAAGHAARALALTSSLRPLLDMLEQNPRPDVVFNLCEEIAGSSVAEPLVPGVLELHDVPYTGSGPECLALVRNKARTK